MAGIGTIIQKIDTGQDFQVISNDFFDSITALEGGVITANFGLDVSQSAFILEYLRIYDYILKNGFVNIGSQGFSQEILEVVKKGFSNPDYEGVNKSIEKNIKSFREKYPERDLAEYIRKLNAERIERIRGDLAQRLGAEVAIATDKKFVYAITRQDEKVRGSHRPHNFRWWELDRGYEPWYDPNCRCTYIYETDRELIDALGLEQL